MSIDVMKQALEALETPIHEQPFGLTQAAITALRTAISEAEKQEPVAHLWQHSETGRTRIVMPDQIITTDATWFVVGPLHLGTPPAAQRQHVTDGSPCWCNPETRYTDPETGASVIVHKVPQ
jgi:hypothetical protein